MTRRDLEARYADKSTTPLPEPERLRELMRSCGCGAGYLDLDAGRDAHELVFGHRPHQSARDPTPHPGHDPEPDETE